jgi:integrase
MNGELEVSFKEAAESWLVGAQKRKRRPMRPSTVPTIRAALDKYLFPVLGDLDLSAVHNGSVKKAVAAMHDAGLSPKTINTYTGVVKTVVASVLDEESGEPVYHRKWRADILDLPVIENQKQPCYKPEEIEGIISALPRLHPERVLYILLASTGLRISEALGLERMKHLVKNSYRFVTIEQQVDKFGKIVPWAKTRAGIRQVDLHPDVSILLKDYVIRSRKMGTGCDFLFPSRNGTPQLPRNLLRNLSEYTDSAFHAFRRFRESHLSEMSCNHDIKIYWMGHRAESMSELYSKLKEKVEVRQKEAERVGVGFDLNRYQIVKVAV